MMKIFPYLALIAFLTLLVITVIYLSRKFAWMFGIENITPLYILFSLIPIYFLTAGVLFMNATSMFGHVFYRIAAILIGIYIFLIMSLLLVNGIALIVKFQPIVFGIVVLSLTTIVSVFSYWNASHIRNTRIDIPIDGLTNELKAVHLSDIHLGQFRTNGFLNKIVEKTNNENPDMVFITGDFLDSKYALNKKCFEPLKQLNAPVYFVSGNHDHSTNNAKIVALMKEVGVNVLENELVCLNGLQIIGLNHMSADRSSFDIHATGQKSTIQEVLPTLGINKEVPAVVLHHSPNGIKYAQENGVELYLAGHTHAGQIFPFNLISNLVFEYNRGLHDYKGTLVIVSEGVGTVGPPFRLGTKSEIITLNLKPNKL